jgi:hypothetical protein
MVIGATIRIPDGHCNARDDSAARISDGAEDAPGNSLTESRPNRSQTWKRQDYKENQKKPKLSYHSPSSLTLGHLNKNYLQCHTLEINQISKRLSPLTWENKQPIRNSCSNHAIHLPRINFPQFTKNLKKTKGKKLSRNKLFTPQTPVQYYFPHLESINLEF